MSQEKQKEPGHNDLVPIDNNLVQRITAIEKVLNESAMMNSDTTGHMLQSFKRANLLIELRTFFDNEDVKKLVKAMQNTTIGFLTDRPPGGKKEQYEWNVVKDCCIEALLSGYHLDGNEFNIISSKTYPAKNGLHRKIIETEGVSDFRFNLSPARMENGKAKVQGYATWKVKGTQQSIGLGDDQADKCFIVVK
ncbi:MAG: hypothetical protein GY866_09440, partial [Proteobacteria bacterium]|nr:hypothetical protein [Pseudomonadota bacterium]